MAIYSKKDYSSYTGLSLLVTYKTNLYVLTNILLYILTNSIFFILLSYITVHKGHWELLMLQFVIYLLTYTHTHTYIYRTVTE